MPSVSADWQAKKIKNLTNLYCKCWEKCILRENKMIDTGMRSLIYGRLALHTSLCGNIPLPLYTYAIWMYNQ
jgi:hypothetical protein